MKYHELCTIYPVDNEAVKDIEEDMKENGFVTGHPITTLNGKILDGRHRHMAASNLGIKPLYKKFTGKDPLAFVIRENSNRRQMTAMQRAVAGEKLANMSHGRSERKSSQKKEGKGSQDPLPQNSQQNHEVTEPEISVEKAAKMFKTSPKSIKRVKQVKKADTKLYEAMVNNEVTSIKGAVDTVKAKKHKIETYVPDEEYTADTIDEAYEKALDEEARLSDAYAEEKKAEAEHKQAERIAQEEEQRRLEKEKAERLTRNTTESNISIQAAFMEMGIAPSLLPRIEEATLKIIFKGLAKQRHPDKGGTTEAMMRLKGAYERILNDRISCVTNLEDEF